LIWISKIPFFLTTAEFTESEYFLITNSFTQRPPRLRGEKSEFLFTTGRSQSSEYLLIVKEPIKKFVTWFAGCKMLALPWKILSIPVIYAIESKGGVILSYDDAGRRQVIDLIRQIKRESALMMFDNEAYQISIFSHDPRLCGE